MPSVPFKKCGYCQESWASRAAFLADPAIELIGYQANSVIIEKGLFLFNHSCGDTLSIEVAAFVDLHQGPILRAEKADASLCPGYCQHPNELRACPVACECAYVRDLLQLLKEPPADLVLATSS